MKQEMIQKAKTEEENRKALIDKFQGSLEEITKSLGKSPPTQNSLATYAKIKNKFQKRIRNSIVLWSKIMTDLGKVWPLFY